MTRSLSMILCGLVLVGMLTSCTTVKMSSWTNPEFKDRELGRTMVIAVSDSKIVRQQFEDQFVERLKELGVDAVASIELFPNDDLQTKKQLEDHLQGAGCDSVIITAVVGERDGMDYVPPVRYPSSYGYYGWAYSYSMSPGYVYNYTEMDLETNVYDADSGVMMWSGETQITDDVSKEANIRAVTRAAVKALESSGLL